MKLVKSIIALTLSTFFLSSAITASSVYATGSIHNSTPSNNCFLWLNHAYYFGGSITSPTDRIEVTYACRVSEDNNTPNLIPITTLNENSSNTYYGFVFTPASYFYSSPYPEFTSTGWQFGPFMKFVAFFSDGSQDQPFYSNRDSTFFYSNSNNSSFIQAATGNIPNVSYSYNCAAFAFNQTANGWLWPSCFNVTYNTSNVTNYVTNTLGYTQNTSPYHTYADVIAYGKSNHINHFAKVVAWDSNGNPTMIESKWGGLEVIKSTSMNPFNDNYEYGHPMEYYNAP